MILYQDFTWLPSILQQKINNCFGCNLKPRSAAAAVHLFEMPLFFHSFLTLLNPVISACTFLVTDCHYIVKTLPGWLLLIQRCQPAETYQEKTKDIPELGEKWSRRNLHVFDIYILLSSFFSENSLNLLPQAEEWTLNTKEKKKSHFEDGEQDKELEVLTLLRPFLVMEKDRIVKLTRSQKC